MLWLACRAPEHQVGPQRGLVADHAEHVPCHTPVLAVDGGLRGDLDRAAVEQLHVGP